MVQGFSCFEVKKLYIQRSRLRIVYEAVADQATRQAVDLTRRCNPVSAVVEHVDFLALVVPDGFVFTQEAVTDKEKVFLRGAQSAPKRGRVWYRSGST